MVDPRNPIALARLAECEEPAVTVSPSGHWLVAVADYAEEISQELADGEIEQANLQETITEAADAQVPLYTNEMWTIFVDLGAYNEDITELVSEKSTMEERARIALFLIAERLLTSLIFVDGEEV